MVLGGYLMAGGANAINMWFDRDIDDKMSRTRLRPIPAGRIRPPPGWPSGSASDSWPSRSSGTRSTHSAPGWRWRPPLLRLHLYHLAQAIEPAEHRDRRRGRRVSAAGGLGGGDRPAGPGGHLPVRHHLLLDSAPFLGPGPDQAGRVRQGRGSDAAGGAGGASEPSSRCWRTP